MQRALPLSLPLANPMRRHCNFFSHQPLKVRGLANHGFVALASSHYLTRPIPFFYDMPNLENHRAGQMGPRATGCGHPCSTATTFERILALWRSRADVTHWLVPSMGCLIGASSRPSGHSQKRKTVIFLHTQQTFSKQQHFLDLPFRVPAKRFLGDWVFKFMNPAVQIVPFCRITYIRYNVNQRIGSHCAGPKGDEKLDKVFVMLTFQRWK